METNHMTYQQFMDREIRIWGEDYIFDLFDRGYNVVLTTSGYKWVMPLRSETLSATLGSRGNTTSR